MLKKKQPLKTKQNKQIFVKFRDNFTSNLFFEDKYSAPGFVCLFVCFFQFLTPETGCVIPKMIIC